MKASFSKLETNLLALRDAIDAVIGEIENIKSESPHTVKVPDGVAKHLKILNGGKWRKRHK